MNAPPPARRRFSLPFVDSRIETPTAMTFRFSTRGSGFAFRSNQAIRLQLSGIDDPWGPTRLFSLSSSPTETDAIGITSKMTGSPFKEGLKRLRPGDLVDVFGPLGDLLYDPTRPTIMIAGGIGITPFRGMIRFAADTGAKEPIVLLYSARTPEEFTFRAELDSLSKRHSPLGIHYTVTRPEEAESRWRGRVGRIDEPMIREAARPLDHPNYLVVGLPEMVESTVGMLEGRLGIPEDCINWEPFRGY
jgi:glycine betaine catabolism B